MALNMVTDPSGGVVTSVPDIVPNTNDMTVMWYATYPAAPAGDFYTFFYYGDDPATLYVDYIWIGIGGTNDIIFDVFGTSVNTAILNDYGLRHWCYTRQGNQHKLYIDGTLIYTLNVDITTGFSLTHQYFSTDTFASDFVPHHIAYWREWNVALTESEVLAEMNSPEFATVKTANLWRETDFTADYNDSSGNGRNWTVVGGAQAFTTGPLNQYDAGQQFARPIKTNSLPFSITQEAHAGGTTYDLFYRYAAASSDSVLSAFLVGNLTPYDVRTTVLVGTPGSMSTLLFLSGIANKPVQIPVTLTSGFQPSDTNYYFRAANFSGNPTPAQLTVSLQKGNTNPIAAGDIFINDDTNGFPGVFRDPVTGNVKNFVRPFPNGEGGDQIESTGYMVVEDFQNNQIAVYNNQFEFVRNIAFGNGFTWVKANTTAGRFVSINNDNPPTYLLTDSLGVSLGTVSMTGEPQGVGSVTINNDASIIYWTNNVANTPVRRWDVAGAAALSDLVPAVASHFVTELEFLKDGTLLVSYRSGTTIFYIERYNESGTLLNTYTLDNETIPAGTQPRIARGLDDPLSFWAWSHNTNGTSRFRQIQVSDGTVLTDLNNQVEYETGIYNKTASLTPDARFGHSFSCYFFITKDPVPSTNNPPLPPGGPPTIIVGGADGGLYELVPGNRKLNDTLWVSFPSDTQDVKKPDPTATTGDLGS